jgi:hypothetical protein
LSISNNYKKINEILFSIERILYEPNFGNCSISVNRVSYLLVNVNIDIVNSPIKIKTSIVDAINKNIFVEHKPQIRIKHITNVIIDDANKHNDKYLKIHRSYEKQKSGFFFLKFFFVLTIYPTSARL